MLEGYLTGIKGLDRLEGSGVADLLQLYLDEGLEALVRLRGSYCGLIVDPRSSSAHVFNDRRASRPLFVREDADGTLRAGPELAELAKAPTGVSQIDPVAVCEFVLFASCYNDRTLFDGIRKLRPASVLTLTPDGRRQGKRYWQLRIDPDRPPGRTDDLVDQALEHMDRACRAARVAATHPVLLLSGGGDSRVILASLRRTDWSVDAVTYGTSEGDDAAIAHRLASICRLPFSQFDIPLDALQDSFIEGALRSDGQAETIDSPTLGALYAHLATSHDGYLQGDRAFCSPLPTPRDDAVTVAGPIGFERARRFADMLTPDVRSFAEAAISRTLDDMHASGGQLAPIDHRDKTYFEQRIANRQNGFAAANLRQLEQIRPWLDEDFVDFQFSLPPELRVQRRIVRLMIERVAPDLAAVPYAEKDSIPQSQTYRRLMATQPAMAAFVRHQFSEAFDARLSQMFQPGELERLVESLASAAAYPTPSRLWWQRLPAGWRLVARRYAADLLHPVRIVLRLMQINIFLQAVKPH
jgi:asparagine synthetase B (glutamine-hydrolysing)